MRISDIERTIALVNVLLAVRNGEVIPKRRPSHVASWALQEAISLEYVTASVPFQVTGVGRAYLEHIGEWHDDA